MPKYPPAGLTQHVLNNFIKKSPHQVTQDDDSALLQRLEVEITGHQSVRRRGGVIAVLYKTRSVRLSEPSWEREMDLQLSRTHILCYWAGTPDQQRQNSSARTTAFTAGCALVAQRELSRNNGERFLAPGYACVPRAEWILCYRGTALPKGAHFW